MRFFQQSVTYALFSLDVVYETVADFLLRPEFHLAKVGSVAVLFSLLTLSTTAHASADEVGCVSTNIRMLGLANDKICVSAFEDPKVDGVVCHISRAETGGAAGMVGVAEDTSDASVSCRQTGPITIKGELENGERVFKESRSFLFKKLQVVRFYDKGNNTLVYLSYSDTIINGSPKNTMSTVPVMPWGQK